MTLNFLPGLLSRSHSILSSWKVDERSESLSTMHLSHLLPVLWLELTY